MQKLVDRCAEVYQGDSLAVAYGLEPARSMVGWSCRVQVRVEHDTPALVDEVFTDLSDDRREVIGQVQTIALEPGDYVLAAELSNSETNQSRETHTRLTVLPQYVY